MSETSNIALMSSTELASYIARLEGQQRDLLKALRALMRARKAEEEAANGGGE